VQCPLCLGGGRLKQPLVDDAPQIVIKPLLRQEEKLILRGGKNRQDAG